MVYLPPYSPTLAPVEMIFGFIKSNIKKKYQSKSINFGKKEGNEAI
jgi:transposase